MQILGIETSCDETSIAIVDGNRKILFHKTLSQDSKYGGIVPEVASRKHLENIKLILQELVGLCDLSTIDAIAVTAGPGLIGSLMVGVVCAKAIASVLKKPIIAVNHLAGHALTIQLIEEVQYPFLTLLVSGGNTQFLIVKDVDNYTKIGETLDDALGEAFDKVARMLGFGYPGGAIIERRANFGDENKYVLAKPMINSPNCNFSFSGLKTDVARKIQSLQPLDEQKICDLCASFQKSVTDVLAKKILLAFEKFALETGKACNDFVLCGGVSANQYIRNKLIDLCRLHNVRFLSSPLSLCGDNAAMIALVGVEKFKKGLIDNINFAPRAQWPL